MDLLKFYLSSSLLMNTTVLPATKESNIRLHTRLFLLFSWAFFLGTKDETFYILKDFIALIENQLNKKVKAIRCDNGTEFQNAKLIALCGEKRIKRDYSNAKTPQQNGVAERKNITLIEAAKSMLADSKLPTMFWTEAVSTACYVLNRVSITNPHNKTPCELLSGKVPIIRHLKPFGCQVTILNTSDHLGKFKGKTNDGFLVGYAAHSKAYRVYNLSSKKVEETLNMRYLEDKPNVQGLGREWYFDLDYLTDSLGYTRCKSNPPAGPKVHDVFAPMENNLNYAEELARLQRQEHKAHSATVKYGFEFTNKTTEMLHQAKIGTRRNLVLVAGDPAGSIVSTGGVHAGSVPAGSIPTSSVHAGSIPTSSIPTSSVPACSIPTSSVFAGSVPAGDVPASSIPAAGVLAGSIDSTGFSVHAASESVLAVFTTDHAAVSPLPPGHSLGSSEHSIRFPSLSDLGNHQPTAGIFSSSSYDDDFCADVTNLASNVDVDPVATKRVNTIHPQSQIIGELQSPVQTRSTVRKSKFGESAFISYVHNQNRTNHADHLHCLFACFLSQLEPSSVAKALANPNWVAAMQEEMQQFYNQQVWKLVHLPARKIAIETKWILKNKRDARGIMVRNKARLVAQSHRQEEGIDYDEHHYRRGTIDNTLFLKKDSRHIILVQVYVDDIIFGSTN
nr:ribonuclease H-like domain-containing protein [Tanacetum cinerariifolium]